MELISLFCMLPLWVRAAVVLFLIFCAWSVLGKGIFWVLSIIPFLIRKLFFLLYQLIELPVTLLHKKFGAVFYKVDNLMAKLGEKADKALKSWYHAWHTQYKHKFGILFVIFILCWSFIVLPSFIPGENKVFHAGEKIYLSGEQFLTSQLKEHGLYEPVDEAMTIKKEMENGEEDTSSFEVRLVVSGVSNSLLVRDIPDVENGIALERLMNGDTVVWTGEMVFAEAENDHVETWAKVKTVNGTEGWSRLFYLCPESYENRTFFIEKEG